MPFAIVNKCQLYYETFGKGENQKTPIVLIHGSTQTGSSCWRLAAPLLAQRYLVIVPDCRGHGQSSNPQMSYSFKEMAADMAGLITQLGFSRAHIVGHSNGGNIALVTLMEHADVVQSAILQAANAFVSPDLIEKEPSIFDPKRVAQEAPEWMEEMIHLHGPTHGQNYWLELLALTVNEIIREPNYSPEALEKVTRPVLVIQGENDRVNAPAGHAQFISQNIPHAQQWLPKGIGHNVHNESLFEWIERVFSFLEERGDDFNDALFRYRQDHYPDVRVTLFKVNAIDRPVGSSIPLLTLQGTVLTQDQSQSAEQLMTRLTNRKINNQLQVLSQHAAWALIGRTVTDLRQEPGNHAERISQALLGEVVQVLEQQGDWSWVRLEKDSYLGWVQSAALVHASEEKIRDYQKNCNARVIAELLPAFTPSSSKLHGMESNEYAGKIPFGVPVLVDRFIDQKAQIYLPDGTHWVVDRNGLLTIEESPAPDEAGIRLTIQYLKRFIGVPYLWGGRTPFGFDCSGLAQTFLNFIGIAVPRDADQQFKVGSPVNDDPLPGDLLFFGERERQNCQRFANISHVAISLGGSEFIHANGTAWGVSYNSLNPKSPGYRPWLREHLAGIRRYR